MAEGGQALLALAAMAVLLSAAGAAFPERVFVGAVDQDLHANESCLVGNGAGRYASQVRLARVPLLESKGPCYARYVGAQLYRGETYYLQLDSHMTMVPRWDEVLIDQARLAGPHACLSTYPPDVAIYGTNAAAEPYTLCESYWNERGLLVFRASVPLPPRPTPRLIGFAAAGFMFCPATILADVPFDPDLPMLFSGEEILYTARLWTSGYDVYALGSNVVFHLYSGASSTRPKFWEDQPDYFPTMIRSEEKVKYLLGLHPARPTGAIIQPRHGLGAERPLEAFWRHVHVDPTSQTAASGAHFCPEHQGPW
ncbi:hypothetical protein WJX81_001014 [Elliptochloris bilobata]|uniref:Uncharacterized protein n=1 Tax=Elliptochloris bilobata TaxID=381761 RepID=A0AAW1QAG3_9CHLO